MRAVLMFLALCAAAPPKARADNVLAIPFYSQLDGRWKYNQLGTCPDTTIGSEGCALTSMAMILAFRGAYVDPAMLNRFLTDWGGYSDGCLVRWDVAAGYQWTCWLLYLGWGTLTTPYDLKQAIDGRKLMVARSLRYPGITHFVVITGYRGSGNSWSDFTYFDPSDTRKTERRLLDGWVMPGNGTRIFKY